MSVATTRAREGSAASECEEKATDDIPARPGSAEDASAWDSGLTSIATMRSREGSAASECEEKVTDNMPVTPGSAEDASSAWDNGLTSMAITRACEGSAGTECEEKAADNMPATPGSNLDEIREYVQRTMTGESAAVIDNVTYDLWRKALEAETDSQERTDENLSTRRRELGTRQRPSTRGSLRALARRGLLGRRSHS
jgi:hypothetical protein